MTRYAQNQMTERRGRRGGMAAVLAATFALFAFAPAIPVAFASEDTVNCEDCEGCGDGGCGSGSCPAQGTNAGANDSVKFTFQIGNANFDDSAGGMIIYEEEPVAGMALPSSFNWWGSRNVSGLEVIEDGNDAIRQALTPQVLMDVVEDTGATHEATDIALYHRPDPLPAKVGGVYPVTGLTPYQTIRVEALAVDGSSKVTTFLATWDPDGDSATTDDQRRWVWEWNDLGANGTGWKMGVGVNASGTMTSGESVDYLVTKDIGNDQYTETREMMKPSDSTVVSKVVETYETFAWGDELIKREAYPTASAAEADRLTTTYTYYDDSANDGDNYTRIETMTDERGYWERYEYDQYGRVTETIRQYEDEALDLSDLTALRNANVVQAIAYLDLELDDVSAGNSDGNDDEVEVTTTTVAGTLVRTAYEVEWSRSYPQATADATVTEDWSIACVSADPENGYVGTTGFLNALVASSNHLGHRVTKTRRYASGQTDEFEVESMAYPDGTIALYSYPADGETVVERGEPNSAKDDVVYGTTTTAKVDVAGNALSTLRERTTDGTTWFTEMFEATTAADAFGRPTEVTTWYGADAASAKTWNLTGAPPTGAAYDVAMQYGCCGIDSRTDMRGIATTYTYDDLGRQTNVTDGAGVTTHATYDAAGRVLTTTREPISGSSIVVRTSTYDLAGRMASVEDALGNFMFYTYRRVDADASNSEIGDAYNASTDSAFYWETRVYPHAYSGSGDWTAAGNPPPVRVTWTDSHGNTVREWSADATSGSWDGDTATAPTGDETLAELTRTTMAYDWDDRLVSTRVYHDLDSLSLAQDGTSGTHYVVANTTVYDPLGRAVRTADAVGNISAMVYDDRGRVIEQWAGTDATGATPDNPSNAGASPNNLKLVARLFYDTNRDGTGTDRPWATRTWSVGPNVTAPITANDPAATAIDTANYVETDIDQVYTTASGGLEFRKMQSTPLVGPWSEQVYDDRGRMIEANTYENGTTTLLARQATVYADDTGAVGTRHQLTASKQHSVTGGTAGDYLETAYAYDAAGRQVRVIAPQGLIQKTAFDPHGRTLRSVAVALEGADADAAHLVGGFPETDFTDDVVLTETAYTYDDADNVTVVSSYDRHHDTADTVTGLLSGQTTPTDHARETHAATWYDPANRPTHTAQYDAENP
ncbi:MAG: hypothetical protein AAGI54_03855 [Planctomycetota bacterium]